MVLRSFVFVFVFVFLKIVFCIPVLQGDSETLSLSSSFSFSMSLLLCLCSYVYLSCRVVLRRFLANLREIEKALPCVARVECICKQVFVVFRTDESESGHDDIPRVFFL